MSGRYVVTEGTVPEGEHPFSGESVYVLYDMTLDRPVEDGPWNRFQATDVGRRIAQHFADTLNRGTTYGTTADDWMWVGADYHMFSSFGESYASSTVDDIVRRIRRGTLNDRRKLVAEASRRWRAMMRLYEEAFDTEPRSAMAARINEAWTAAGHEWVEYTDMFLPSMRHYTEVQA